MCTKPFTKTERCCCGKYFGSTKAGDAHRVGKHGVTEGPNRRRCMTTEEMLAKIIESRAMKGEPWFAVRLDKAGCEVWVVNKAKDARWDVPRDLAEAVVSQLGALVPPKPLARAA